MVAALPRRHDRSHMHTARTTGRTLTLGAVSLAGGVALAVAGDMVVKAVPWVVANAMFLAAATHVWRRRPDASGSFWFAATAAGFAVSQVLDGAARVAADADVGVGLLWLALAHQVTVAAASVITAQFVGRFPHDEATVDRGHAALRALWWLLALPVVSLVVAPAAGFPAYMQIAPVPSPLHVTALAPLAGPVTVLVEAAQGAFAVGVVVLVLRYRRETEPARQRIRWLLLPALLTVFAVTADLGSQLLAPELTSTRVVAAVGGVLWIIALVSLPAASAVALTRPRLVDVDLLLRRSLVYGVLWSLIAAVYVGAAIALGVAAGQRFPVEVAIGLTVIATIAFQPARRRLERTADRWVFGERLGRYEALRRLGQALEDSVDHDDVLRRLADTVQEGLRLPWVRVTAAGADTSSLEAVAGTPQQDPQPSVVVPIVDAGETVGHIACGTTAGRPLADEDRELLESLARRAGLSVRALRLTRELGDSVQVLQQRTSELEESRTRLVRVQDEERRRLERDLHDGVQQDVVALMGRVGLARRQVARGEAGEGPALEEVHDELGRILSVLRELARGIHPTVLSDRGLVEAVEAQAARSPVPVQVVADALVRAQRYGTDVEGAAFFTVCEALTNVLKHADCEQAEVRLERRNGTLHVQVRDAGRGFDQRRVTPGGLRNLAERVEALGGRLAVASQPGRGTTVTAELVLGGVDVDA
jgi:signal transduction histidine kinase